MKTHTANPAVTTCLVLVLACTLPQGGCALGQKFQTDPVGAVGDIVSTVETIISIARLVFGQVVVHLPADTQPKAQAAFDKAVVDIARAEDVARGLVRAGKSMSDTDVVAALGALTSAAVALKAIVDSFYPPPQVGRALPAPEAYEVLVNRVAALKSDVAARTGPGGVPK